MKSNKHWTKICANVFQLNDIKMRNNFDSYLKCDNTA